MANQGNWWEPGAEVIRTARDNWGGLFSLAHGLKLPRRSQHVSFAASSFGLATPSTPGARAQGAKEEVGRATWTLLHTMAAQYPHKPSRKQQKDVRTFIDCLTRLYPCPDCAKHFQELVKKKPPQTGSAADLQRWMCELHNDVNKRLGKSEFNCHYVQSRWEAIKCDENSETACDLLGTKR